MVNRAPEHGRRYGVLHHHHRRGSDFRIGDASCLFKESPPCRKRTLTSRNALGALDRTIASSSGCIRSLETVKAYLGLRMCFVNRVISRSRDSNLVFYL